MTQHLPHPPFMFDLAVFVPGRLEAIGFIGGKRVASHQVRTPLTPARLELKIDAAGILSSKDEPDMLIAHAQVLDKNGALCVTDSSTIEFGVTGHAELVGPAVAAAEAGIASVVMWVPRGSDEFAIQASRSAREGKFLTHCSWRRNDQAATALPS